jgi:hypothetical protein
MNDMMLIKKEYPLPNTKESETDTELEMDEH